MEGLQGSSLHPLCHYLGVQDIMSISSVCKLCNNMINEGTSSDYIWQGVNERFFGGKKDANQTWRHLYKMNAMIYKNKQKINTNQKWQIITEWAIKSGHGALLRTLWQEGKCKDVKIKSGKQILKQAATTQNLSMIKWCVELKIQADWAKVICGLLGVLPLKKVISLIKSTLPNMTEDNTKTLLEGALTRVNLPASKYLLENYTTKDFLVKTLQTYFRIALNHNRKDCLDMLKSHCDKIGLNWKEVKVKQEEARAKIFEPLICFAARKNYVTSLEWLLENGCTIDEFHQANLMPIQTCCQKPKSDKVCDTIEVLLKYGADINEIKDGKLLMPAVICGYLELTKYLISKGDNFEKYQQSQISMVNSTTSLKMMNYLIDIGYPCTSMVYSHAIHLDNNNGDPILYEILDNLLSHGIMINDEMFRCMKSYAMPLKVIKWLEDKCNFDFTKRDEEGNTLLHWALSYQYSNVPYLLSRIDINAQNKNGETALFRSMNWHSIQHCEYLLKAGAKQIPALDKRTPLHVACARSRDSFALVQLLVKHGADVTALDQEGRTPLMVAYQQQTIDLPTIQFLSNFLI